MDILNQPKINEFTILSKSTILYLEDEKVICKETSSIFKKIFKKVLVGEDGVKGLELYNENKENIDIILTDINMPNMNGIEFMAEVRKQDFEIPILIVTAFNDVTILIKAIKLNVTDYIIKPMQLNSTLKIINKILQDKLNQKLILKQKYELEIYKEILDKENLVSETDLDGKITYVNDIFCEVSGYTKEELIGTNHNIIRHPDVSSKIFEQFWETIQNKKIWRGKLKNRAKNGEAYYVKSTIFPILDEDENIEKYVASQFLITEDEEEKHKLKKFIMHQKSEQVKYEKQLQENFEDAINTAKVKKDKEVETFIYELEKQIKLLRAKNSESKGRILFLEKTLKESLTKSDNLQISYKTRIKELHNTAIVATKAYQEYKAKNKILVEKFEKSQKSIQALQDYVDEYRYKISDLKDIIETYESMYGHL